MVITMSQSEQEAPISTVLRLLKEKGKLTSVIFRNSKISSVNYKIITSQEKSTTSRKRSYFINLKLTRIKIAVKQKARKGKA